MSTNYQELLAQKATLEKQAYELQKKIDEARRAERQGVIQQIKALLTEHGLTAEDLQLRAGATAGKGKGSGNKGKKVEPKYRNSSTGETWTGRGLQPKWVQAAVASGKKLEDFLIS